VASGRRQPAGGALGRLVEHWADQPANAGRSPSFEE